MSDEQPTLYRSYTPSISQQRDLFPSVTRLGIEIPGFLHDVVDGLRVRDPQAILLHARTSDFSSKLRWTSGMFDRKRYVPQKDRSSGRHSRNPRGTSYPLLQPLRLGNTIGVLKRFHVQCHQLTAR